MSQKNKQINVRVTDGELEKLDVVVSNMRGRNIINRLSRAEALTVLIEKAYQFAIKDQVSKS